ncbi:hypothetical protein D3C87_2102380 [compost metagenome]
MTSFSPGAIFISDLLSAFWRYSASSSSLNIINDGAMALTLTSGASLRANERVMLSSAALLAA